MVFLLLLVISDFDGLTQSLIEKIRVGAEGLDGDILKNCTLQLLL